jgi:hypothetical protein
MSNYIGVNETFALLLPKEYPISLLLVGGVALCQHYSARFYLKTRKAIFGQLKYMDNFTEDHEIAFEGSKKMHPHGDPDNVDGWYSTKLSYTEWYRLACAKRAH